MESDLDTLCDQLLQAEYVSDQLSTLLRLPYRVIPLQPVAEMRELVARVRFENVVLKRRVAELESKINRLGDATG